MATVSATDAKNRIGELWALAEEAPVTIERNGVAKFQVISTEHYVAVPIDEFDRLKSKRRTPRFGFAKDYFQGVDTDALLAINASTELERSL